METRELALARARQGYDNHPEWRDCEHCRHYTELSIFPYCSLGKFFVRVGATCALWESRGMGGEAAKENDDDRK